MLSFEPAQEPTLELPEVDERLVSPGTRYEIEDGRLAYVPPAKEPQATCHARLCSLALAHRADGYAAAIYMLTRTSRIDDFAPHVSVYPTARNPRTGGRRLEELAFLIADADALTRAGRRAAKLASRGVRRVFAIDVEHTEALEWSQLLSRWLLRDPRSEIEDPVLAVPIPIDAIFEDDRADDAVARAWRLKRHPEFLSERAEGMAKGLAEGMAEGMAKGLAEALFIVLAESGLEPTPDERDRIFEERDLGRLERWVAAAVTRADVAALLAVA
jgi:hypothetical protein